MLNDRNFFGQIHNKKVLPFQSILSIFRLQYSIEPKTRAQ